MSRSRIAWLALAAALVVGPALLAQTGDQPAPAPDTSASSTQAQSDSMLFTGCLMTEPAYRRAHNLGSGALGGVGLGDEFVLVDTKTSASSATAKMPASEMKAIAANAKPSTSPCPDKGVAIRLHGSAEEGWMKNLVGHWLAIDGKYQHPDAIQADGTQKGTKLPAEVNMLSAREVPAPGPATVTESKPATPPPPAPQPEPKVSNPPPPPPATPPSEKKEMPKTAGSDTTIGLVGLLAMTGGIALLLIRRRQA